MRHFGWKLAYWFYSFVYDCQDGYIKARFLRWLRT